jgi:hypothetical protein
MGSTDAPVHPGLILWHDSGVLPVSGDTVRLFLHVLAATISALAALFLGILLAG